MLPYKFNKSRFALLQLRLTISILFLLFAVISKAQVKGGKWIAPKSADAVKNPVVPDAATLKEAKTIYTTYCMPCHGSKGKGDGVAAAGLAIKPADHTSTFIQNQTDGALFWEMSEGHNPMPSYKTTLTEKQRWELISYIRTFAKK
ncbi:cytochrome c [Ferruginibacter paludis]|uniref:c-type cytochrome n=1 Tax=Ferruginibacter paludis TaxID=1310417 RepID=UPI0025B2B0C6|nr:cytochrome c [Ferruginibacter paludis]MDN3657903.1 cytochrome c [Ferruginibacter paludis]